jgi:lipid A disaccharide synthetase
MNWMYHVLVDLLYLIKYLSLINIICALRTNPFIAVLHAYNHISSELLTLAEKTTNLFIKASNNISW